MTERKDKLIRNVDNQLWNRAKSMAHRQGLKMRALIEELLQNWTVEQEKKLAEEVMASSA